LIGLLGVIAVVAGGKSVVSGLDGIVDVVAQPAVEIDNNVRFLSAIWTALGLALLSCVRAPGSRRQALKALLWLVFAGGVGRLVAFWFHGLPATPYLAITASEVFAPLVLLLVPEE